MKSLISWQTSVVTVCVHWITPNLCGNEAVVSLTVTGSSLRVHTLTHTHNGGRESHHRWRLSLSYRRLPRYWTQAQASHQLLLKGFIHLTTRAAYLWYGLLSYASVFFMNVTCVIILCLFYDAWLLYSLLLLFSDFCGKRSSSLSQVSAFFSA